MTANCRTCYLQTLSSYEQERCATEPITGTIAFCGEHQAAEDALMAQVDFSTSVRVARPERIWFSTSVGAQQIGKTDDGTPILANEEGVETMREITDSIIGTPTTEGDA